jgi:hypothetical protein
VVYIDDIVNDQLGIDELKLFQHRTFETQDMGNIKYFLGI